jgi:hypothetical protein
MPSELSDWQQALWNAYSCGIEMRLVPLRKSPLPDGSRPHESSRALVAKTSGPGEKDRRKGTFPLPGSRRTELSALSVLIPSQATKEVTFRCCAHKNTTKGRIASYGKAVWSIERCTVLINQHARPILGASSLRSHNHGQANVGSRPIRRRPSPAHAWDRST